MNRLSRRQLIGIVGAGAATRARAQVATTGIQAKAIEHLSVQVSDLQRSIEFYRKLCGMVPVSENRQKELVRVGYGNRYLIALIRKPPYGLVDHYAISVSDADPQTLAEKLATQGIAPANGEDPGFYVKDPDGAVIQIRAIAAPPPDPGSGVARISMLHHVNTRVSNVTRSEKFYRTVFGLGPSRRVQEPDSYGFGLPDGGLVLLQTSQSPGHHDHFCLGALNFDANRMRTAANEAFPGKVQGTAQDNFVVLDPDGLRVQISAADWTA